MKNVPPKYFAELEKRWARNKVAPERSTEDDWLRRPKGLRAPDLVRELWRLSVCWKDPRFEACLVALVEHGIVGGRVGWNLRFTGQQGPELDGINEKIEGVHREIDRFQLKVVRSIMDLGYSEKRACAEVAAEYGRPAHSFAAAVDQLRHMLQKSGKRARTQKSSQAVARM
jgi:hypothetical protein